MAFAAIAYTAPNYRDYSGSWIKAYEPGTTTSKSMGLDSTGTAFAIKVQIDVDGFIVSAGDAKVIPYIDGAYDLFMFPDEDSADDNDIDNAVRLADNITAESTGSGAGNINFAEETIQLVASQTTVVFATINATGASIYIGSDDVDRGRLFKTIDFTVTNDTTVELNKSLPAGSYCSGVSNEITPSSTTGDVKKADTIADVIADVSLQINAAINVREVVSGDGDTALWDSVLASSVTIDGDNVRQCVGAPTLAVVRRDSQLDGATGLTHKKVIKELDVTFPSYAAALALSSDATSLFPQGLEVFQDRIYIIYGAGGGTLAEMWIVVYDINTYEELSVFRVSDRFGEGIAVYEESGDIFLISRNNVSPTDQVGKFNVTILPTNLSTPTPVAVFAIDPNSFICTDGNYIYVQEEVGQGGITRRNKFGTYDKDFNFISFKYFKEQEFGSISSSSTQPKAQNINCVNGQFYATFGSNHSLGDPETNRQQQGIRVFSDMCHEVDSFMLVGDTFIDILVANGYDVSFVEYEGISTMNQRPVSLVVIASPGSTETGGLLLIEEGNQAGIDFSSARSLRGEAMENLVGNRKIVQSNTGILNPVDAELLTSLIPILDWMYNTGTSVFEFYTTGSNIDDINDVELAQGLFVELKTGNYFSWNMETISSTVTTASWITRQSESNYTQVDKV